MKKSNYQVLKRQIEIINEIEDTYFPEMSKGEDPVIDDKTFREAIFDQAYILFIYLEEVLEDEEDYLE